MKNSLPPSIAFSRDRSEQGATSIALSVVIPLYNEEESILLLFEAVTTHLAKLGMSYEIIFVDDGSSDGSFAILEQLYHQHDGLVRVIRFRRNFGKTPALLAGFQQSRGEIVFTMDADLQDDPAELGRFLEKINEGYDLVSGWKFPRRDPLSKTFPSRVFNRLVAMLTRVPLHDINNGFKAYRRSVIDELKLYGELHRFVPVMASWRGFKVTEIKVNHRPRRYGQSKFGAKRFANGLLDLLMVLFLTSYMHTPLRFFGPLGILLLLVGASIDIYLGTIKLFWNEALAKHTPLLFLSVILVITGLQFISTGLLGEMMRNFSFDPKDEYSIRQVLE